jgi:glycosyltransferase involved in cell wall biosynthesis
MPSLPRTVFLASYPPDGGVGEHVVSIVRGLDPERWRFEVACLPSSMIEREIGALANVRVHHLKGCHPRPSPRDELDLPQLLRLVGPPDVIHAHSSKAGFLVRLAAALRGRRSQTIFTPHAWSFWAVGGKEARTYTALERMAAHWCRTIVTVSESEREAGLAAKVGRPEQYMVIPNGIDLDKYARDPAPVPGRIVMVGRLSRQKRPDVALRAFAELRRSHPEARLDVLADGPLRRETEELLAELGLGDAVRLLGDRPDVADRLAEAACLLLTSDYEGCPLAVLEAMAAGVPVVATDVRGVRELVRHGETGLLAEARRPDLLAAQLSDLLADPQKARAMGLAGRRLARAQFSSQRMLADVEGLYREVAGGGNGHD